MRTIEEQLHQIKKMEFDLRKRNRRRQVAMLTVGTALCAVLLLCTVIKRFPSVQSEAVDQTPIFYGGMLAADPWIGFLIVIILAFLLGVFATLLSLKILKRRNKRDA